MPDPIDAQALIVIEVGKNKSPEKALGEIDASSEAEGPLPGDAAKVYRELRYTDLKVGYVLQFFDHRRQNEANAVGIAKNLRGYADQIGQERFRIAVAIYSSIDGPQVWLYPQSRRDRLALPFPEEGRGIPEHGAAVRALQRNP